VVLVVVPLLILLVGGRDCEVAPLEALQVTGAFVWGEDGLDGVYVSAGGRHYDKGCEE